MNDEIKGLVERLEQCLDGWCSIISGSDGTTGFAPPRVGPGSYQWIEQVTEEAAAALALSDEARVRAERERDEARTALLRIDPDWFRRDETTCAYPDCGCGFDAICHVAIDADRAQASEALVRELVEGLRPFGMLAEKWGIDDPNWDDDDIMLFANREGRLSEPPLLLVVGDFRKAQALILRAEGEEKGSSQSQPVLASNGHGEAELSAAVERLKADLERDPNNLEAADARVLIGALNGGPAGLLLEYDGEFDTGYRFVKTGDAMRPGWERGARQTPLYTRSAAKSFGGGEG